MKLELNNESLYIIAGHKYFWLFGYTVYGYTEFYRPDGKTICNVANDMLDAGFVKKVDLKSVTRLEKILYGIP